MLKKVFDIAKKIILSVLLIYTYNKLAIPLDIIIPINVVTVLLVYFCGMPSILCLILLFNGII